jgi:hypothetical protein
MKLNILLKNNFMKTIILILSIMLFCSGCDMFTQEIPPDKLPPIPQECLPLNNEYSNAIYGAQTAAKVSQMQISRVTNEFMKCMQDAGLSKAEALGIVKNQENIIKEKIEKEGVQSPQFYR